jgi:hypothetical protein
MNTMQRLLVGFMLLVIAGFLLYPEWHIEGTVQLDYVYCYDKDLAEPRSPDGIFARGFDRVRLKDTRRAFLIPGPRRPHPLIPPSKAERTGTGTLDLGRRHTLYTDARVTEFTARVNRVKTVREILLLLVPLAMFLTMFRTKPPPPRILAVSRQDGTQVAGEPQRLGPGQ